MEGKKQIAMSAENQLNNYAKQQGMVRLLRNEVFSWQSV